MGREDELIERVTVILADKRWAHLTEEQKEAWRNNTRAVVDALRALRVTPAEVLAYHSDGPALRP